MHSNHPLRAISVQDAAGMEPDSSAHAAKRARIGPACLFSDATRGPFSSFLDLSSLTPAAPLAHARDEPGASSTSSSSGAGRPRSAWPACSANEPSGGTGRADPDVYGSLGARELRAPPRDVLASLQAAASQDTQEFRKNAASTIEACIGAARGPSTVARYSSVIRALVNQTESKAEAALLPCDSDEKFMFLFASMDKRPWSSVTVARAAVRAWHEERGLEALFDAAWTPRAALLWRGLKKRADLSLSKTKVAMSLADLQDFAKARLAARTPAGLRDAAAASVCFFGVRRCAEMRAFVVTDVSRSETHFELLVRKQKNDPFGQGMRCVLPRLPALGPQCPCDLLQRWLDCRARLWPDCPQGPLFCVTGAKNCRAVSADTMRRALASHFNRSEVGSHSLRKGGAHYWKVDCRAPEELIQAQGGWSSPEVMPAVYAKYSERERADILLRCASVPGSAIASGQPARSAQVLADLPGNGLDPPWLRRLR